MGRWCGVGRLIVAGAALAVVVATTGASKPVLAASGDPVAKGDIDADGRADRAMVVRRTRADALPRVFVAIFADTNGDWHLVGTVELDPGAVVERLRLAPGRLTAEFRRHYPVDPPGSPSQRIVRSWAFVDGALHGGKPLDEAGPWVRSAAAQLLR